MSNISKSTIQKITPVNLDAEKTKFFFDTEYNPQFIYKEEFNPDVLTEWGQPDDTYLDLVENILNTVLKKWETETAFIASEGSILNKADVLKAIQDYFEPLKKVRKLNVQFSPNYLARTSVYRDNMYIRIPIEYRSLSFPGVLDHEIGTHYLRRWNDSHQPWYGKKKQFHFHPHLETEEGLAILHQFLTLEHKHLWLMSVHYYAVYWGSKLSFAELFKHLAKYIDNKERRWRVCLRVKRGVKDTSIPEVFTKDQIYLRGVIKLINWLEKNNYAAERLYLGKIAVEDVEIAEAQANKDKVVLPWFLADAEKKEWYIQQIQNIRKVNDLP